MLQEALSRVFKSLLKPERVKTVKITRVRGNIVSGFLLTHCPVGDRDNWKDFEAHMPDTETDSAVYMIVDGRRFRPSALGKEEIYELIAKSFRGPSGSQGDSAA